MHKVIVLPLIERMGIMGQQEFNEVNQWEMGKVLTLRKKYCRHQELPEAD